MNFISPHIKFAALADLAEGNLPGTEKEPLLTHLSNCRRCSEKLDQLKSTVEMMRADRMEDAPPQAIESVKKLLRAHIKPSPSVVQQLLGTLKFDSLQSIPAFGMRSGAIAQRQLVYSAGQTDLQLQIHQTGEFWSISGQVLGPPVGGVAELQGPVQTVVASLNEMSEFSFASIAAGTYVLTLKFPESEMKIPELNLGL
jgi:anti-sigma factor RsiW